MQQCPHCGELLESTKNPPRFCSGCGKPLHSPGDDLTQPYSPATTAPYVEAGDAVALPDSVGGYRLLRPLGEGGMGSVFEGEEIATGRRVAVKLIRAEYADSSDAVERFRREGRLASKIAHPRCVFVFAADEEAGRPYIVMELMPGTTLVSLVERYGTLKPREAIGRILDVIDGLQEAHRSGLIHRDVKPSNCFIDADGRVKVGDFGLSKALAADAQLTQTGSFLGTLLYAAPEQIRNDRVDQQADVYSVAATLYFLLTGRAPFQADDTDGAAALARTLTETAAPIRQRRPDVPTSLDAVVLRGLERDRRRRWANLEEFRLALLPFLRDQRSFAQLGWRIGAYLVDLLFLFTAGLLLQIALGILYSHELLPGTFGKALGWVMVNGFPVLYFFALEWPFGGSPGKLLFHLRIRTALRNDRLGMWRMLLRTLAWFVLYNAPSWVVLGLGAVVLPGSGAEHTMFLGILVFGAYPFTWVAGLLLLGCTMRPGNGFRALHDFLTGTMVIRLPSTRVPRLLAGVAAPPTPTPMPGHGPERFGAFVVRGLMSRTGDDQLLLGEDGGLHRRVWLWVRPRAAAELSMPRRNLNRTARPRWLASGREGGRRWDAFVASSGCLLTDLRTGDQRFEWAEGLPVLQDLAEELAAACADSTLPRVLSLEQVWIDAAGRVQLLDLPVRDTEEIDHEPEPERRALNFLRQVTARTLEGRLRTPQDAGPIRAPLPDQAAVLLRRLMIPQDNGGERAFTTVRAVRTALRAAREAPVEVTRRRRSAHLLTLAPLVGGGLLWLFLVSFFMTVTAYEANLTATAYAEEAQELLQETSAADLAAHQRLDDKRARLLHERERLLDSHLGFVRPLVEQLVDRPRRYSNQPGAMWRPESPGERGRRLEALVDELQIERREFRFLWMMLLLMPLLVVAAVWPLWSAATRGGAGQWVAGVRVLQADGRSAARWRCLWRAFLVSLPFTALLAVSVGVEGWRLTGGTDGETQPWIPWAWLVWLTWWLGLAIIPLFVMLALRWPNRGVHDRLAGTYLVPH